MTLLPRNISEKGLALPSPLSTSLGMMKQIGFPTLISGASPASGCSVTLQSTLHILGLCQACLGRQTSKPAPHATTKITLTLQKIHCWLYSKIHFGVKKLQIRKKKSAKPDLSLDILQDLLQRYVPIIETPQVNKQIFKFYRYHPKEKKLVKHKWHDYLMGTAKC